MPKREPEQVWKALVKEAADDEAEFQRAAGATPEEVDRSLTAKGLDPTVEREKAGEWRREIEQRVALRKAREAEQKVRSRSNRPRPRSSPIVWLIAATVGAAVGGALVDAMTHPAPPAPAPTPPAPTPSFEPPPDDSVVENPLVAAATLRRDAFAECEAKRWDTCLAYLDRARGLDPAGDESKQIKTARDEAIKAIVSRGNKP